MIKLSSDFMVWAHIWESYTTCNQNKICNNILIRNNNKKRVLKYIFYKDIISLKKYKLLNIIA